MDYRELLKNPASIGYIKYILQSVYDNPEDFGNVFSLIFDSDNNVAWRAGWVCDKISRKNPQWFSTEHVQKIMNALLCLEHQSVQRELLVILNYLPLPEDISVELINKFFDWMITPASTVSLQVLSMKLLYKISMKQPDFKQELNAYLLNCTEDGYTCGFYACRKKILKLLNTK